MRNFGFSLLWGGSVLLVGTWLADMFFKLALPSWAPLVVIALGLIATAVGFAIVIGTSPAPK
jgi:hypothetical protein